MQHKYLIYAWFLVGLSLLPITAPVWAQHDIESSILAIVNEDTIYAHALTAELGRIHSGQHDTSRTKFDVEKLVEKLINERLMVQDATTIGLNEESEYKARVENHRLKSAVDQLLADVMPDSVPISDDEIQTSFLRQFRKFHLYLLILKQKTQADSIALALNHGAKLEEVAAKYAQDQYRLGGGDRGMKYWLELNNVLQAQADSAQIGIPRGPFSYREGYAFLQILKTAPADTAELKTFRPRIKGTMIRQRMEAIHKTFVDSLKVKFAVQVNDSLLNAAVIITDSATFNLPDSDLVVASFGDSTITLNQLRHKILHSAFSRTPEMLNPMKYSVLEEMIQTRIFGKEAIARGYTVSNRQVKWDTEAYSDSLLIVDYLSQTVSPRVQITAAMQDTFYAAHKDYYHAADQVKISQMTVVDEDSARRVLERLNAGAEFSWLVKQCSLDRYKVTAGDRGWMSLNDFPPEVRKVLDTLETGEVIGPYGARDGQILLKVTDRKPGEALGLDQVRGAVDESLKQMEFDRSLSEVLVQLKANSKITINHEALKKLQFSARRGE
jgi:parvulin-like peptidyl-prolyl isomerase